MSYALLGWDGDKNKIEVFIDDRLYHTYLVGSTGYGKTSLITQLVLQDAKLKSPKQGLLVLDPLGGLVDNILHYLPKDRIEDVVLLQLDSKYPIWGMNLYECPDITNLGEVDKAMERVMRVWNKIFAITPQTPLLETLMRNLSYAIIFNPPYTMIEIPRFLRDKAFRQQLTANIPFEEVRWFWEDFETLSKHDYREQVDAVRRRFDSFLIPTFKPIIGQYKSTINFVNLMNEGKIVLVKMNPELPAASQLMGSILTSLLLMAAYARPIGERKQFNLYVDEFQQFAGKEFSILYENARQFKLGALLSHQHRSQIPEDLTDLAESLMQASTFITLQTTPQTARELSAKFDSTAAEPKMEEVGRQPIMTPRIDTIQWLLRGNTHRNDEVNDFITTYKLREFEIKEPAPEFINAINSLCFQAMRLKQAEAIHITRSDCETLHSFFISLKMPPSSHIYLQSILAAIPATSWDTMTLPALINFLVSSSGKLLVEREYHKDKLSRCLFSIYQEINKLFPLEGARIPIDDLRRRVAVSAQLPAIIQKCFQQEPYTNSSWISVTFDDSQWNIGDQVYYEPYSFAGSTYYNHKKSGYQANFGLQFGSHLKWYNPQALEAEIDRIIASPQGRIPDKQPVVKIFTDLLALLRALAVNPIESSSGEEEPILRPGQKDTPDQIRDKITNEIIHLETGHARVRLKQEPINLNTKVCHRCGKVHPITGEIKDGKKHVTFLPDVCEDCKIPIRTEYLIKLAQPEDEKDKDGKLKFPRAPNIESRVQWIIENNLRQGYLRKREDVEREIAARQQALTSPQPAPVPAAKTPQQPPTPPPMKPRNKII